MLGSGFEARAAPVAKDLHASADVIDLHADTPFHLVQRGGYSLAKRLDFNQLDVPRMRAGNLGGEFFVLWPPRRAVRRGRAKAFCLRALAAIRKAARESGAITMVDSVDSFRAARAQGRIAGFLGMEGADCLDGQVDDLARWRKEGVRYLGLTWNTSNPFATAAADRRRRRRGLTARGRRLVAEANRLGVLVDVSHASARTFWDVYGVARAPVIASHSCSASLRRHYRNVDDEQARAIARSGGVIGVNFYRKFVKARGPVTVDDVARHVVHLAKVAGARHVALGSDFDGLITLPDGLKDAAALPNLTAALLRHGLTASEVRGVLGANVLRVLGDAGRDVHAGPRRGPLRVRRVRPWRARRLFDRNDLTRWRRRGWVRARVDGRPTHLAVVPCAPGSLRLELRRGRRVAWKAKLQLEDRRLEIALPELPKARYRLRLRGAKCLGEVTLYGPR